MGPDRLDKFIKKQVEQHKTPTDPDLLWQKIQAKQNVEEKPKRRFLIFWLLGGALLFTSLGLLYTYQFSNNDETLTSNENPIENTTTNNSTNKTTNTNSSDQTNSDQTNSNTNSTTDLYNQTTSSVDLNTADETPNEYSNKNTSTGSNDSDATVSNDTQLNNTKPNQPTTVITKSNDRFAKAKTTNTVTDNNEAATSPTIPSANKDVTTDNNQQASGSNKQSSSASQNTIEQKDTDQAKASNQNILPSQENNSDKTKVSPIAFTKSELLLIADLNFIFNDQGIDNQFVENQKKQEKFPDYKFNPLYDVDDNDNDNGNGNGNEKPKNWGFSNGLAFTYGKAPRTLSNRQAVTDDYLQTRNDMETSLDAVRINLDFMAQHKSGLYLKSGIEYEQINERFNSYETWDSTVVEPEQVLAIVYPMIGEPTERIGERENVSTFWYQTKRYNRYHSIDIPLLVGYNSAKNNTDKKFSWFVEAGASINLWFKARGEIYNTADQAIRLEDNPNLFKPTTGLSLMATSGLNYRLADKFSIWASPTIKYHLNSITSKENTLDQKYLNVGLQVGIRYHWSK